MVKIPKKGGWGCPTFGKNSQIIPYFFFEGFPYHDHHDCLDYHDDHDNDIDGHNHYHKGANNANFKTIFLKLSLEVPVRLNHSLKFLQSCQLLPKLKNLVLSNEQSLSGKLTFLPVYISTNK